MIVFYLKITVSRWRGGLTVWRIVLKLKTEGNPNVFIYIQIEKSNGFIKIYMFNYAKEMLAKIQMCDAKVAKTPISKNREDSSLPYDNFPCRESVETSLYLSIKTRHDLSYAVSYWRRFLKIQQHLIFKMWNKTFVT